MNRNSIGLLRRVCKKADVIYCYGAGYVGELIANILSIWNIDFSFVVTKLDSSIHKIKNIPVYTIDDVNHRDNAVFIVAVTEIYQKEIIEKLQEEGIHNYICVELDWLRWIKKKLELEELKKEYLANKEYLAEYCSEMCVPNETLHIIHYEKFTTGYINFMKMKMLDYKHHFAVIGDYKDAAVRPIDCNNVIYLNGYADLRRNIKIRVLIKKVSKIIMSGVWAGDMAVYPQSILDKVYLQFWGGDFYDLRYTEWRRKHVSRIQRMLKYRLLRRCRANIFLIAHEQDVYQDITGIKKTSYVAPMPEDPLKKDNYQYQRRWDKTSKLRVAVGNSATKENCHIEVFNMLAKWKDQIEVICPLSYGDFQYREVIIEKGREILGNSFRPIVNFMERQKFIDLLSTCMVSIYYNNRQQAVGNIYINFRLGNKIYLRKGTSMWKEFLDMGFKVYEVENILDETLRQFVDYSDEIVESNKRIAAITTSIDRIQEKWEYVLNAV